MAVEQVSSQPYVPAWKRLGLKLKNSPSANGGSESSPTTGTTLETKSNKRKAEDIVADAGPSHDQPAIQDRSARSEAKLRNAPAKSEERPLKRKKSVSFVDGTKREDGDANEKLLEEYAAQQQGGEDEFTKAEIAQFTAPTKVHPANQPSIKVHNKIDTDDKGAKKKDKLKKKRDDAKDQPQLDTAYILYLKEYHSSRATWKFNKNHQTKLLQNLYNTYRIPTALDDALASYLSGLQGDATRKRLAETAEKIVSESDDLEGAEAIMPGQINLDEAKERALRAQLKQKKGIERNKQAAEEAYSDEHQEKLRKRKRAVLIMRSLSASNPRSNADIGLPANKNKSRRSRKMRTGVPDDDDTDETSSVSSVPSSGDSADEEEESSEEDDTGSDSSSTVSSSSDSDSSSDGSDSDSDESA